MTTLTIMRILPREVDPMVYKMSLEDPKGASFAGIGGLGDQVRELREVRPCCLSLVFSPLDRVVGYRTATVEPRTFRSRWDQATKRSSSVRSSWYWKDTSGQSCSCNTPNQLLESRFLSDR